MSDSVPSNTYSAQEVSTSLLRDRFFRNVSEESENGCWIWHGPTHARGYGRFFWRVDQGGPGRYVPAHKMATYIATGEWPRYMRNLCDQKLCCRASHWWTSTQKPKQKAIRGRVRQLTDEQIRHVRLLSVLSHDETTVGQQYGLTRRQVAQIALGRTRLEAGGRIRGSRHLGVKHYHAEFERELQSLSMKPHDPVVPQPPPVISNESRPFQHMSYGNGPPRRRLRW